jgi:hypothetical protein
MVAARQFRGRGTLRTLERDLIRTRTAEGRSRVRILRHKTLRVVSKSVYTISGSALL